MKLFDSHCHIDFPEFDADRDEVLQHCAGLGIKGLVIPGIACDSWQRQSEVCGSYPGLYPAYGLHPFFIARHGPEDIEILQRYIREFSPVAIGEIGLDYVMPAEEHEAQRHYFEAQLQLARKLDLPVIIHARKSHQDVLALLKKYRLNKGVIHAYSGSEAQAMEYIKLGFKLGFGGALTWEQSSRQRSLAENLPLASVVIETDAPDMAPQSARGGRNSPEYLPEIFAALAAQRYESQEEIAEQLAENVKILFNVPL